MALGVLATKLGMTQIFTEEGVCIPVTVLKLEETKVLQHKTAERDGYTALQVGYGERSAKRVTKAMAGHFKKGDTGPKRLVREFRVPAETLEQYAVGSTIGTEVLADVKSVDVTGESKGKGFAGVMKRHNMKGFRATHGTHEYFRHGGSIGCRAIPGRVWKGKKMAGQMGAKRVAAINLNVIEVAPDGDIVLIRGAVPGGKGGVVELRASSRNARAIPGLAGEAQARSKNPMKASKAGGK